MEEADVFGRLRKACIVAVLVLDRTEDALPVAEALQAGGVTAIELTLRTPVALAALVKIKQAFPDLLCGAGTVLTPAQVQEAQAAGADFAVAPGMNRRVVEAARAFGLPFAPGICTPSDIEQALEYDCALLKYFPAEASGGLAMLRALAAPYAHRSLQYIPLGGLSPANVVDYLREPIVGGIGGSWLAPRATIAARDWLVITTLARGVIALRDRERPPTQETLCPL